MLLADFFSGAAEGLVPPFSSPYSKKGITDTMWNLVPPSNEMHLTALGTGAFGGAIRPIDGQGAGKEFRG